MFFLLNIDCFALLIFMEISNRYQVVPFPKQISKSKMIYQLVFVWNMSSVCVCVFGGGG